MFKKRLPNRSQKATLIFGVAPRGARLIAQSALTLEMGPQRSQSAPNDIKLNENDREDPKMGN